MRRRDFIKVIAGSAVAWPLGARAQQPALPLVGYLSVEDRPHLTAAFQRGLSETGYIENQNVAIDYRFTSQYDQLPALATNLVSRRIAVLTVSGGPSVALAAKTATETIPIVFILGVDPVQLGMVASFNHPTRNATGVYIVTTALEAKRLELLRELLPDASVIGALVNPTSSENQEKLREIREAAQALGLQVYFVNASSDREFDSAFANLVQHKIHALVVTADGFLNTRPKQLAALAAQHAIPTIYAWREFISAGGLMSYGTNLTDAFRQSGIYTGHILKGEKPTEMPVQQSTKVELVINLKTAKALGLRFPITLLGRADEVIE
jgi:putative tryptophan/tyrosine transport system substrate-binding protein